MSSSNCCFLTCIQVSQEAGQVVWYSHLFQNFPQFIVIHTVKGFGIVNKAEIDVFLELSCFFNDPVDVSNLISGSSALTTSNLPWFMDVTFQVPMQYCSLQHQTLLPSPVTSTTGCCFRFGSIFSFFPELFFHWFPVAYWTPTNLGSSPFSVLSFCLFILVMEFSRQEYWSGLPFPSPVGHILSELYTMTSPSRVALHGMAHSCIELDKAVVYVIRLAGFLRLCFSFCVPSDGEG